MQRRGTQRTSQAQWSCWTPIASKKIVRTSSLRSVIRKGSVVPYVGIPAASSSMLVALRSAVGVVTRSHSRQARQRKAHMSRLESGFLLCIS